MFDTIFITSAKARLNDVERSHCGSFKDLSDGKRAFCEVSEDSVTLQRGLFGQFQKFLRKFVNFRLSSKSSFGALLQTNETICFSLEMSFIDV